MPTADRTIIASTTHEVLHDQETERDPAVQRPDLALVGQQLDDDDRAGKRQRDRDVDSRHRIEPEAETDERSRRPR